MKLDNGNTFEGVVFPIHKVLPDGNSFKKELIQELYEIRTPQVDTIEGKMSVVRKDKIKEIIGRSPDISDAMAFRMVFEIGGGDDFYMGFA